MRTTIQAFILALFILSSVRFAHAQATVGYKMPSYEKFKLPNGLTVYLMEKHTVPVMSIRVIMPAGAIDNGDKAGLAYLTSSCLTTGTKHYTKSQIDEQVDFMGAILNAYSGTENSVVTAKFAVKDRDKMLPIVQDILLNATFPDTEFVKIKKQELSSIEQAKESPASVIRDYWKKFIYGNHLYGNVVKGTTASLSALTTDDVKAFYKNYYSPAGAAIAVVGDFNNKEMKGTITSLFSNWKGSPLSAKASVEPVTDTLSKTRVLLVNKDDAKETTFLIGAMGITRSNPDYLAVQVVNTVFGGRFTSLLNEELRVKTGLTYGAFSSFDYFKDAGTFYINTHTANATTKAAIDTALAVLNHLHIMPLDATTLTSAKNYMIGLFPPQYQTTDQLAYLLTDMFWYGYNESYINNFEANVNAVTLGKANEIISKYFPKDKLQMVLIGKAADIRSIAASYGPVLEREIKDDIEKGL